MSTRDADLQSCVLGLNRLLSVKVFAVLAVFAGAVPSVAFAQDSAADASDSQTAAAETGGLEEVSVTARRVTEDVQRVPETVTVFTPTQLDHIDVHDITALDNDIPGVEVCCTTWNSFAVVVRGIPGTATYFADVPANSNGYANYFDIGNVQVLKGPQGTLFGEAAVAGAMVFEPNKPSPTLGGYAQVTLGDYDRRTFEGAVNLPLIDDTLYARLAVISNYRDGYIHDLSLNIDYGNQNYYVFRPSLIWQITDKLQNYTMFQTQHSSDNGSEGGLWVLSDINFNPLQPSSVALMAQLNGGGYGAYVGNPTVKGTPAYTAFQAYYALAEQMLLLQEQLTPYTVIGTDSGCAFTHGGPTLGPQPNPLTGIAISSLAAPQKACPGDWNNDSTVVNTTTYNISDSWTVKNIFGTYWGQSYQSQLDGDMTPLILLDFNSALQTAPVPDPNQWSDEVQVHGTAGRFSVTGGLFWVKSVSDTGLLYNDFDTFASATITDTETDEKAVYANVDVNLDDLLRGLTLTAGARWNTDYTQQTSLTVDPSTGPAFGTPIKVLGVSVAANQPAGHLTDTNVPFTFGLRYQATPQTMVFLTDSKGFSAGGFQSTPGIGTYKPQSLNNLEGGVKSTFQVGGMTARVNASAYYGWFDNIQVAIWSTYSAPITDVPTVGFLTQNAATATIKGVDADITLIPSRWIEMEAAASYLDDTYTQWNSFEPAVNRVVSLADTPFVQAPTWKVSFKSTVHLPFPSQWGRLDLFEDWSYRDFEENIAQPKQPIVAGNPDTGLICSRKRTIANGYPAALADGSTAWVECVAPQNNLNLGIDWHDVMGHDRVTASFQVSNVTGNEVMDSPVMLDYSFGYSARQPAVPRMFFGSLRYTF